MVIFLRAFRCHRDLATWDLAKWDSAKRDSAKREDTTTTDGSNEARMAAL